MTAHRSARTGKFVTKAAAKRAPATTVKEKRTRCAKIAKAAEMLVDRDAEIARPMTRPARPIIFSAPMVRALIDGRKTQTRRALKPQPPEGYGPLILGWGAPILIDKNGEEYPGDEIFQIWSECGEWGQQLRHHTGDRLWVRERWFDPQMDGGRVLYAADAPEVHPIHRKRASIHMPRWASRLTLTVTDVRVQRLHDISEADAMEEGVTPRLVPPDGGSAPHIEGFRDLWRDTHGPGSWEANPWVCALTITVERRNIDA